MSDKSKLEELYAAKMRDRMAKTSKEQASPVFKLTEVKRADGNFWIQCCIR
jgi:hypothetical protein